MKPKDDEEEEKEEEEEGEQPSKVEPMEEEALPCAGFAMADA